MEKRQVIMAEASKLFAKKGFEATSVQNITDACNMSKGAFYLSFKSKDELILALIDHFMAQVITDVDYAVRSERNEANLLYVFYYTVFQTFQQHSDFAKLFVKEQVQTFNDELILKIHAYDREMESIIQEMLERLYGEAIAPIIHDLIYCVKGFMKLYAELFIFYHLAMDLDKLAKSLVEKTVILAKHTTMPFVTPELFALRQKPVIQAPTKAEILAMIDQTMEEVEAGRERESLVLLKSEVNDPMLHPVLVMGLIENIRKHPYCQQIAYVLTGYFEAMAKKGK